MFSDWVEAGEGESAVRGVLSCDYDRGQGRYITVFLFDRSPCLIGPVASEDRENRLAPWRASASALLVYKHTIQSLNDGSRVTSQKQIAQKGRRTSSCQRGRTVRSGGVGRILMVTHALGARLYVCTKRKNHASNAQCTRLAVNHVRCTVVPYQNTHTGPAPCSARPKQVAAHLGRAATAPCRDGHAEQRGGWADLHCCPPR